MDDEEKEEDEDSPPMCGKEKEVRIVENRWTDKEKDKKVAPHEVGWLTFDVPVLVVLAASETLFFFSFLPRGGGGGPCRFHVSF